MIDLLIISLSVSVMIALMLILTPLLKRRYSAKWRYIVWILLALRLVIPLRFELPSAPVIIPDMERVAAPSKSLAPTKSYAPAERERSENDKFLSEAKNDTIFTALGVTGSIDLNKIMIIIWAIGAASFFLWHAVSYIVFRRRTKPYCERISRRVYRCSRVESPLMVGFFRPEILIPDTDYTPEELEIIIAHEMTHYKRHDIWYKLLLLIANSAHWFNPLVHVMVRCADRDIEYSCDDAVVNGKDAQYRKTYSRVILKTIGKRSGQ